MDVSVIRGIWGLHKMYLKWSQTVRDKEFLVEMHLKNLEPEDTKEQSAEKKDEKEKEEAVVRDLLVSQRRRTASAVAYVYAYITDTGTTMDTRPIPASDVR